MDSGTSVGKLYYDLNIDDKNLKSQLDNADKSVKSFGDRISKYWGDSVDASKKLMLGVAAVGAATVAFGVSSVKAYEESDTALTQLGAVLKSTGGAAGVTKDSAIALSKEIQRTTSMSDEAALAVENMGLTFTAIGKNIFPQATRAAIDMATALNHGMKPSAEQSADAMKLLGKALQDPDAGLGALHRVGVNTDELAKKFVGLTDKTQKQKLILQELGTEFGGSAAAQAKTFTGRMDQLKNSFNDLQEQVGQVIVKALGPVADWLGKVVDKITAAGGLVKVATDIWNKHKETIILVGAAIAGALLPAIISMTIAFGEFLLTIAPWALLGVAVVLLFQKLGISMDDVINFAKKLKNRFSDLWVSIKKLGDELKPLEPALSAVLKLLKSEAVRQFRLALEELLIIINLITDSIKYINEKIQSLKDAFSKVKIWAAEMRSNIQSTLDGIRNFLEPWRADFVGKFKETFKQAFDALVQYDIDTIQRWRDNIANITSTVITGFQALPGKIATAIEGIATAVGNFFLALPGRISNFVTTAATGIANFFLDMPGHIIKYFEDTYNAIKDWLTGLPARLQIEATNAGNQMGDNVATGVKSNFSDVGKMAKIGEFILIGLGVAVASILIGAADLSIKILIAIRNGFGKAQEWLYNAGRDIIQGLINGIKDKFNDVKNTLGDLTKKMTSWKGPETTDKILLVKNAQLIMGGFVKGLESQYPMVKDSLSSLTDSLGANIIAPTMSANGSSSINAGTAGNVVNNAGTNITVNMSGILASGQTDLRLVGKKIIGAVNEELRSRGKPELGAING